MLFRASSSILQYMLHFILSGWNCISSDCLLCMYIYIYVCVLCCTVLHVIIALSLYHYMIPCVLYSYYAHFKNSRPYYVISCFVKLCILSQYITLCHIVTYHVTLNHVISHRYHDHIVL